MLCDDRTDDDDDGNDDDDSDVDMLPRPVGIPVVEIGRPERIVDPEGGGVDEFDNVSGAGELQDWTTVRATCRPAVMEKQTRIRHQKIRDSNSDREGTSSLCRPLKLI